MVGSINDPRDDYAAKANTPTPSFQDSWFGNIPSGFIISAVTLYVAGWGYVFGYYSAFGLSLRDVSFEVNEIMVLGSKGFPSWLLFLVSLLAGLLLGSLLWWMKKWSGPRYSRLLIVRWPPEGSVELARGHADRYLEISIHRLADIFKFGLGLFLLIGLSRGAIHYGRMDAADDMSERTKLSQAEFQLDKNSDLLAIAADGYITGYIIAHGRNGYYILPRPLQGFGQIHGQTGHVEVLFIPETAVRGARIYTGLDR